MVGISSSLVLAVATVAMFFQLFLKTLVFETFGYGRSLDAFGKFNVTCEKVEKVGLDGCVDMWLHSESGLLYLVCSDSTSRRDWFPTYFSS